MLFKFLPSFENSKMISVKKKKIKIFLTTLEQETTQTSAPARLLVWRSMSVVVGALEPDLPVQFHRLCELSLDFF
jgi:hypothetical protein